MGFPTEDHSPLSPVKRLQMDRCLEWPQKAQKQQNDEITTNAGGLV
jgi:hypothetical protein